MASMRTGTPAAGPKFTVNGSIAYRFPLNAIITLSFQKLQYVGEIEANV